MLPAIASEQAAAPPAPAPCQVIAAAGGDTLWSSCSCKPQSSLLIVRGRRTGVLSTLEIAIATGAASAERPPRLQVAARRLSSAHTPGERRAAARALSDMSWYCWAPPPLNLPFHPHLRVLLHQPPSHHVPAAASFLILTSAMPLSARLGSPLPTSRRGILLSAPLLALPHVHTPKVQAAATRPLLDLPMRR